GGLCWTEGRINQTIAIQAQDIADLMLKGIGNAVDDLAGTDDEFPTRRCPDGPRAGVGPAERKSVIERSIRVITDEWASRMIRRGVDVPKQDVFAIGQKNASPWRDLRGEKRRVEVSIQQDRAASRRFWNSHGMTGMRQGKQHRD